MESTRTFSFYLNHKQKFTAEFSVINKKSQGWEGWVMPAWPYLGCTFILGRTFMNLDE